MWKNTTIIHHKLSWSKSLLDVTYFLCKFFLLNSLNCKWKIQFIKWDYSYHSLYYSSMIVCCTCSMNIFPEGDYLQKEFRIFVKNATRFNGLPILAHCSIPTPPNTSENDIFRVYRNETRAKERVKEREEQWFYQTHITLPLPLLSWKKIEKEDKYTGFLVI